MRFLTPFLLCCTLLPASGCSSRTNTLRIPEGVISLVDAGTPTFEDPPCDSNQTLRLRSDFRHCGTCETHCSEPDADRCVNEVCMCGLGVECGPGLDCRYGRCFAADPSGSPCEFDPECHAGEYCIEGFCSFAECVAEVCDAADNDCDGLVDEGVEGGPLARWCWSGPAEDALHIILPCRSGVQICLPEGVWSPCEGEIPPVPEQGFLGCNHRDDDCDGCVDGVWDSTLDICVSRAPSAFDVVFLLDTSGSMDSVREAQKSAVEAFAARTAASTSFRYGGVLIPGRVDGTLSVFSTLTDFPSFQRALSGTSSVSGGGSEPSYDAVWELGFGETDMNWTIGSVRVLILFTDEEAQSFRFSRRAFPLVVDETIMCESLDHGEVFAVVTDPIFFENWDQCASLFELSDDAASMATALDTIIEDPCL